MAPIIGIVVNLQMGMKQYQSEDSSEVNKNMRFKYETLESLFQKTDAFNERGLALFLKLKEAVWSKLENNSSTNEVQFIKRYENMIEELQMLIRTKESEEIKQIEKRKSEKSSKGPQQIMGGV